MGHAADALERPSVESLTNPFHKCQQNDPRRKPRRRSSSLMPEGGRFYDAGGTLASRFVDMVEREDLKSLMIFHLNFGSACPRSREKRLPLTQLQKRLEDFPTFRRFLS